LKTHPVATELAWTSDYAERVAPAATGVRLRLGRALAAQKKGLMRHIDALSPQCFRRGGAAFPRFGQGARRKTWLGLFMKTRDDRTGPWIHAVFRD
jgi:hypothetical protein